MFRSTCAFAGLIASASELVDAAPKPPIFGPVMTAPFFQTITIEGYTWANEVQFMYDSTTKPVGQSLYIHSSGQHDELCTSIKGKEGSEEPCTLLASNDLWRYVIFPESQLCCRYCNTSQYCGIIRPDWLQQNATYQGTKAFSGTTCYGWLKIGGEQNYYYATADGTPCQYYEGYPTFNVGNNTWNFNLSSFSRAPIPGSTFAVPSNMGCEQQCQITDMPYEQRLAMRLGKQ